MELLFESRVNLKIFTGMLRFVQHRPTIRPEPVLLPDSYTDRKGLSIYGSVLQDGGRLRMWYQSMSEEWDYKGDMASVAYAESDDGINWTKPALNVLPHGPGPNNLVDLGLHSPSVFIDPHSPPSHRYRATGCCTVHHHLHHPDVTVRGYYTSHSADGLHWTLDSTHPRWEHTDVITSIYHPWQQRGIVALKTVPRTGRMVRRCIHTADFKDGAYGEHVSALYPDEADDMIAVHRGYHSCDYYGMGMQAAGSGTVGFIWNYWHTIPYTGEAQVALYGTSDVTLVYQPEPGGLWQHVPGRPIFIDHSEHWWMSGWLNSASCPVEVGDEHRLYFSGQTVTHGFYLDSNWQPMDKWTAWAREHGCGAISYASWPKWRLFGFTGDAEGGFTMDLGELKEDSELFLNYTAGVGGRVRVAEIKLSGNNWPDVVVDGRDLDDCIDLDGDSTGARVVWKNGSVLPRRPGLRTYVKLHIEYATVYAYEVRPVAI